MDEIPLGARRLDRRVVRLRRAREVVFVQPPMVDVDVEPGEDVDEDVHDPWRDNPPYEPDRFNQVLWYRDARFLPPGPPYDAPERLRRLLKDIEYLVCDEAEKQAAFAGVLARKLAYEDVLRQIVMAADRGGSMERYLEEARELLPRTRYRRPPR